MSSRMQSARPPASLVHGGGGGGGGGKSKGGAAGGAGGQRPPSATSGVHDQRAKTILKEAVDAVVNSFAKHTQGYGRGTSPPPAWHYHSASSSANLIMSLLALCVHLGGGGHRSQCRL